MMSKQWGARSDPPAADDAAAWITGAVPDDWFTAAPKVVVDRDEILIVGTLAAPKLDAGTGDEAERATAERGRISAFREETRDRRIRIAQQLEHRYRRRVRLGRGVWRYPGAVHHPLGAGDDPAAPARAAGARRPGRRRRGPVPVGGAGLVRRLVGEHADTWLTELRTAMTAVDELRRRGPDASPAAPPADSEG